MRRLHNHTLFYITFLLSLIPFGNLMSATPAFLRSTSKPMYARPVRFNALHLLTASPDSTPLTKAKVRDYIKARIATDRLQMKMQAHANQYENIYQTFYKKRKIILNNLGWTEKEFESTKNRVYAAISGMDGEAEMKADKQEFKDKIANIRSAKYYSKKQKNQLIEFEYNQRKDERLGIQTTKPDWPAVKPYLKQLDQVDQWFEGEISEPPVIN